jgi:hypothetical protein
MKIHIVANKNWEAEPLLNAFLTRKIYTNIGLPDDIRWPTVQSPGVQSARARFVTKNQQSVKISCIQDFIVDAARESSSQYKYEQALPRLFEADDSELVVCFGTAGYPVQIDVNGCVMIGHHFFVHSGRDDNPHSQLNLPNEDTLIGLEGPDSNVGQLYSVARPDRLSAQIASLLQRPPNTTCRQLFISASNANVAISNINITNYDDYLWADAIGIAAMAAVAPHHRCASVETTHGIVACYVLNNLKCSSVMWVSAITDREGLFDFEVTPMQNYVCAYNAGLALAKIIDSL